MSKKVQEALTRVLMAAQAVVNEEGELLKNTASRGHLHPLLMAIQGLEFNLEEWKQLNTADVQDAFRVWSMDEERLNRMARENGEKDGAGPET